jgi:hypothetical protein
MLIQLIPNRELGTVGPAKIRGISCRTIDPGCLSNPKHAITGDPVGFTAPEKEVTLFKN